MTMPTMPACSLAGGHDGGSPETLLDCAERLVTVMQRKVDAQAWPELPALADELHDRLTRFEQASREVPSPDAARRSALAVRLAEIAGRHAAVLEVLTSARDRTATELADALQGHSAAAHYLNAAGGS